MRCRGRLGYAVCDVMGWKHSGDENDTIFELRTPLYGMIDAQDLFDEYFATKLVEYGLVMACEDITKHIWVKVPPALRGSDADNVPKWQASDITFTLGKYVDDTRFGGQDSEAAMFEVFLEDTIGLRESNRVSRMLSKEYDLGKSIDGKFSHRMTMNMQPTIQKYVRDMKEICLEKKISFPSFSATPGAVTPARNTEAGVFTPLEMMRFKGELGWLSVKGQPQIAASTRLIQSQVRPTKASDRATVRVYSFLEVDSWSIAFLDERDAAFSEDRIQAPPNN